MQQTMVPTAGQLQFRKLWMPLSTGLFHQASAALLTMKGPFPLYKEALLEIMLLSAHGVMLCP